MEVTYKNPTEKFVTFNIRVASVYRAR